MNWLLGHFLQILEASPSTPPALEEMAGVCGLWSQAAVIVAAEAAASPKFKPLQVKAIDLTATGPHAPDW